MRGRTLALLACLLGAGSLAAGNWPQWRGPQLDGTSPETNLPLRWGPDENVAWKLALPAGGGSSPIVWNDRVFLLVSHDPASDDSIELWAVERPTRARTESPDAYSTPIAYRHGERWEIAVSGGDAVTAHDPVTGKELWRATVLNPEDDPSWRIVATPLYTAGLVVASGKRKPLVALSPGGSGDVTATHVAWTHDQSTDVPTPVSDGERLYVVTDRGMALCFETRTGKLLWGPARLDTGTHSASPVLGDGKVYATSEDGVTAVFAAAAEFRLLAKNELAGFTLSSPAISDGQIFLRTADFLYAIGERVTTEKKTK